MTSKRKHGEVERKAKRLRRRKRSRSESLRSDPESAEKRQALKRLFGRVCSAELNRPPQGSNDDDYAFRDFVDENEDPLLDFVPVDMDPEQLGFLVCAQETLRFLQDRGIPSHHPMFSRLRMRLLQGIDEMSLA